MVGKCSIVIAALAGCAAGMVGMGSAAAATQVPFTITETSIQFSPTTTPATSRPPARSVPLAHSLTPIEPSRGSRGSPEW
jgi:hypothetical protein